MCLHMVALVLTTYMDLVETASSIYALSEFNLG